MVERRERVPRPAKAPRPVAVRRVAAGAASEPPGRASLASRLGLSPEGKRLVLVFGSCITIAILFPLPIIKYALMAVLGVYMVSLFLSDLPLALCLLPLVIPASTIIGETFSVLPGLNYETL